MRKIILLVAITACVVLTAALVMSRAKPKQDGSADLASVQGPIEGQGPQWEVVRKWIASTGPPNRSALRMQVIRPGVILPAEAETYPPAPDDLSIVITRQGNQPARIEVRQGKHEWKVTEKELDRLPPEIRLHVERPLGWVLEGPAARAAISGLLPTGTQAMPPSPRIISSDYLERRLDELDARIEALLKSIETLHKSTRR